MKQMSGQVDSNSRQVSVAMALMVLAMLMIPGMDSTAKWLALEFGISPGSIVFGRFFIQAVILYILIAAQSKSWRVYSNRPGYNMFRGVLNSCASLIFFVALKYMPVADAISIFFVEPLILMFLARILLGETLGWRRVVAAIVGFGGALLIIQPSFEQFGPVSLLPLVCAVIFSFYLIFTRKYGAGGDVMSMQFYAGVGGTIFAIAAMLFGDIAGVDDFAGTMPVQFNAYLWLLLVGLISTASHLLIVKAFSMTPAATLAPFQYIEIISATILGLVIFNDFPDALKWSGTAIIIASGMFIFWRERQLVKEQ